MREVCFVLTGERILRVYAGTPTRVPDSRERWEIIWKHRDEITEIVHTHPGGFLAFSGEDLTTMAAIEAATDREFDWSVVTNRGWLRRKGYFGRDEYPSERKAAPWWLDPLRELSFFTSPKLKPNPRKEAKTIL